MTQTWRRLLEDIDPSKGAVLGRLQRTRILEEAILRYVQVFKRPRRGPNRKRSRFDRTSGLKGNELRIPKDLVGAKHAAV